MGGKWGGIDPRQKIGANFGTPWVTMMILYRLIVTFTEKVMLTFLVALVCWSVGLFVFATITQQGAYHGYESAASRLLSFSLRQKSKETFVLSHPPLSPPPIPPQHPPPLPQPSIPTLI